MSDEKFNWSGEDPEVVIARQDAVAVYLNPDNDIVIRRQADWPDEDEDAFIVIPRSAARRFIEAIERLLHPEK